MPNFLENLMEVYGPEPSADGDCTDSHARSRRLRIAIINARLSSTDGVPAFVLPNLSVGSAGAAYNKTALENNGITHILSVCGNNTRFAFEDSFVYKRRTFDDVASSAVAFEAHLLDECLVYMHSILSSYPKAKMLVHCYQGKSRSCAVVTAYLAEFLDLSYNAALEKVQSARTICEINPAFVDVLRRRYHRHE